MGECRRSPGTGGQKPSATPRVRDNVLWAVNHALLRAAELEVFGISSSPIGGRGAKGKAFVDLRLYRVDVPPSDGGESADIIMFPEDATRLAQALTYAEPWALLAFLLMYLLGLRISEVCGLRLADVDLGHGWVHVRRQHYGSKKVYDAATRTSGTIHGRNSTKTEAGLQFFPSVPFCLNSSSPWSSFCTTKAPTRTLD